MRRVLRSHVIGLMLAGLLVILIGGAGRGAAAPQNFGGEQLVITIPGGEQEEDLTKYVVQPFEKLYNARISIVEGSTFDILAKLRAQRANPQIDVWTMGEPGPVIARDEKLVEPMTVADMSSLGTLIPAAQWNRLPDGSYPFVDFELTAIAVGYNPKFAHQVPTSWNQLADPMYKGHLLMPNMNVSAGVVLLVALARANGGSERNIDPGFAAAAKVRQNAITLWTSHDQVATMLSQGTAWVAVESVDRLGPLNRSGAPIDIDYPEDGVVAVGNSMGISAGTRHKKLAEAFLNFLLAPEQEGPLSNAGVFFPPVQGVHISPQQSLYYPPYVMKKAIALDWEQIAQQSDAWQERWNKEIVK